MLRKSDLAAMCLVLLLVPGCSGDKKEAAHEVRITVTEKGFEPSRATIPRGEPIMLIVERKTDQTCAKDIVLEGLAIKKKLPLNQPIRISLPAEVIGDSLGYACGMNMYTGVLVAK